MGQMATINEDDCAARVALFNSAGMVGSKKRQAWPSHKVTSAVIGAAGASWKKIKLEQTKL